MLKLYMFFYFLFGVECCNKTTNKLQFLTLTQITSDISRYLPYPCFLLGTFERARH